MLLMLKTKKKWQLPEVSSSTKRPPTFILTLDTFISQPKEDKYSLQFHFSPFQCDLIVVLSLEKGTYPENSHVVYSHIIL